MELLAYSGISLVPVGPKNKFELSLLRRYPHHIVTPGGRVDPFGAAAFQPVI